MRRHVVLLGDSIPENAAYVPREDPLIDHLREEMPVTQVIPRFRDDYATMLDTVLRLGRNTVVCTIHDQCPFRVAEWRMLVPTALQVFNECILGLAEERSVQVIELRDICVDPEDYSALSPIEPSSLGMIKIAAAVILAL